MNEITQFVILALLFAGTDFLMEMAIKGELSRKTTTIGLGLVTVAFFVSYLLIK